MIEYARPCRVTKKIIFDINTLFRSIEYGTTTSCITKHSVTGGYLEQTTNHNIHYNIHQNVCSNIHYNAQTMSLQYPLQYSLQYQDETIQYINALHTVGTRSIVIELQDRITGLV